MRTNLSKSIKIEGTRATNWDKTSHRDGVCSVGLACVSWCRFHMPTKTITILLGFYREVILLSHYSDYSYKNIVGQFGIAIETTKKTMSRGYPNSPELVANQKCV